jgi:hypothetical protein
VNCERLSVSVLRVGFPLVLLLTVGDLVVMPRVAAGQPQLEGFPLSGGVGAAPDATPRAARLRAQVPCAEVISAQSQQVGLEKGRSVNVVALARRLGSTKTWVAHCMLAYGRHVPVSLKDAQDEDALEKLEEQEPEESAAEDVEEPGAKERDVEADENSKDQHELHADHPKAPVIEKERQPRPRPERSDEDNDFEE